MHSTKKPLVFAGGQYLKNNLLVEHFPETAFEKHIFYFLNHFNNLMRIFQSKPRSHKHEAKI